MISWIYVILAIILEVIATTCMKYSQGFSKILPSILMFVFYALCFTILTLSVKKLELGIVYAVWSGLGTVLITSIGIFLLNESASPIKIGGILLIIIGVVILKLNSEPAIAEETGILSGESAVNINLEITEPVKIQDTITMDKDSTLLIPQLPIKSLEIENL
jgi:small multidrug resistance pump